MAEIKVDSVSARVITDDEIKDRDLFDDMINYGARSTADSADKWQAGIIAITAFVTAGVLFKDPHGAKLLPDPWRIIYLVSTVAALCAAVISLGLLTAVSAGLILVADRDRITAKYKSVEGYIRYRERRTSYLTLIGIVISAAAVLLLVVASAVWAVIPTKDDNRPLSVTTTHGDEHCGRLLDVANSLLLLADDKGTEILRLPITEIDKVSAVSSC